MRACLLLIFALLISAVSLRSQTPAATPASDYVVVVGFSAHPTLVPYTPGMKLLSAIGTAGDATLYTNASFVYLVRCGKKEKVSAKHFRNDPTQEPTLQAWDIIYLPAALF